MLIRQTCFILSRVYPKHDGFRVNNTGSFVG